MLRKCARLVSTTLAKEIEIESDENKQLEIIDQIYAAAIEPERFDELVDIWHEKLVSSGTEGFKNYPGKPERLFPHIQKADLILSLVNEDRSDLPTPLFEKINSEPRPTLVIDANGKIYAVNEPARQHFKLEADDELSDWVSDSSQRDIILSAITRVLSNDHSTSKTKPEFVRVWEMETEKPMLLTLIPWTTASGRKFVLVQSSNFYWPNHLKPVLQNAFGLTSAETDIVKLIVEGASIQDVANIRGSSIATVRSQIKSIYAKTETNNQSEFLRMTLGLATLNLREKDAITGAFFAPPNQVEAVWPLKEHERLMTLQDGRVLEYADCGAPDGLPCIYFHNDFLGNIWPQPAAQSTLQAGLRVIIPSRPYYGRSSPYPKNSINYEQTSDDMIELMDHLGIARALLVSISIGGMYAGALIDAYPERCVGHVLMAPAFSVESPNEEAQMPKFYRFMNSIVKRHPRLLETILKLGLAYHNRVGSVRYLKRILGDVPADISVVQDEENLAALVRALEFSGTHGHLGIYNDYKTILPEMTEKLLKVPFATYTIIGTEDRNSRLLRTDRMIKAGVSIHKVMADGGGSMLLFTHGDLVVKTLLEAWSAISD